MLVVGGTESTPEYPEMSIDVLKPYGASLGGIFLRKQALRRLSETSCSLAVVPRAGIEPARPVKVGGF